MRNKNAKVSDPNSFVTCPGSDEHIIYSSKILSDGTIQLTPCGKESISEKINAEKEFTDIAYIRHRLEMGDTSVLRDGAVYADLYSAPKSLAESMQLQIDAERKFYELPLEVRNKFNNNFRQWMLTAGTPDWIRDMNIIEDVIKEDEEVNKVDTEH